MGMHISLASSLALHTSAVDDLVTKAERVPETEWFTPMTDGKWSPADVLAHLVSTYDTQGEHQMTEAAAFDRTSLRHALATVAYRGGKTLRGATPAFANFRENSTSRSPVEILAHIGDLFEWAYWLSSGEPKWSDAKPLPWDDEVARFYALLARFDAQLASDAEIAAPLAALFQGPVADALTHVGQLAMLRRVAHEPMKGENYFKAQIVIGRVGPDQTAPKREF